MTDALEHLSFASFELQDAIHEVEALQLSATQPRIKDVYTAISKVLYAIQWRTNEDMKTRAMYKGIMDRLTNLEGLCAK